MIHGVLNEIRGAKWNHLSFFPPRYPSLNPLMASLESSLVASKILLRPSFNFSSASSASLDIPFFCSAMVPIIGFVILHVNALQEGMQGIYSPEILS